MSYKNYDTVVANVKNQIETYGVAVIPNVLDQTEINSMQDGMWDILET